MLRRITDALERLVDHYMAGAVLLSLFTLLLMGVGDVTTVGRLGLMLCVVGLAQGHRARVDLWILIPLILYHLTCMASAFRTEGSAIEGYGLLHGMLPLVYLLSACAEGEERRFLEEGCLLWVGLVAGMGVLQYVFQAVTQGWAGRLSGLAGNPNAMGIFLVLGWFLTLEGSRREETGARKLLPLLEPLLLMGAAMTLSMGSFVAMAAGVAVLLWEEKRRNSWRETFRYAARLLARASLGMGTGLLLYLSASRTERPWLCILVALYGLALMAGWRSLEAFLAAKPRMAGGMAAVGVLVALGTVLARPGAAATFAERLEMMKSGLSYLTVNPLFGVGPFHWRLLDLQDGGIYFNTWHIHNVPLHVGVEMGWLAMGAVLLLGLRALIRPQPPERRAMTAAFLLHNLMDTSFFYLGITALVLTAAGETGKSGRELSSNATKLLFALMALPFAYGFFVSLLPVR